jgi:uncharacterized membrane protein YqgA involved in biofilm formation
MSAIPTLEQLALDAAKAHDVAALQSVLAALVGRITTLESRLATTGQSLETKANELKTVSRGDQWAINSNLEGIASGKVKITD